MLWPPLVPGTLIRRYKRFLADVRLDDGREVTAHCANPGAMTSCAVPGWQVWLSHQDDPRRKLPWSWELVESGETVGLVLVNTARPNRIVGEALAAGRVPGLGGYPSVRAEVRYGERSRVDFLLEGGPVTSDGGSGRCWVEVKSVTLRVARSEAGLSSLGEAASSVGRPRSAGGSPSGQAAFPDSVTERGTRHLRELAERVGEGDRAVLFFLLGRTDCDSVRPADEIDPLYGRTLRQAVRDGVEVVAWRVAISGTAVTLDRAIPVDLAMEPRRSR